MEFERRERGGEPLSLGIGSKQIFLKGIPQHRKENERRDSKTWEGNRRKSTYRKKPRGLTTEL